MVNLFDERYYMIPIKFRKWYTIINSRDFMKAYEKFPKELFIDKYDFLSFLYKYLSEKDINIKKFYKIIIVENEDIFGEYIKEILEDIRIITTEFEYNKLLKELDKK